MKTITDTQIINILNSIRERKYTLIRNILKELPNIKDAAIKKIKELRDPKREIYNLNIDEKSAIPVLKEFFGIEEGELE